jgi:hypothetical protein
MVLLMPKMCLLLLDIVLQNHCYIFRFVSSVYKFLNFNFLINAYIMLHFCISITVRSRSVSRKQRMRRRQRSKNCWPSPRKVPPKVLPQSPPKVPSLVVVVVSVEECSLRFYISSFFGTRLCLMESFCLKYQ